MVEFSKCPVHNKPNNGESPRSACSTSLSFRSLEECIGFDRLASKSCVGSRAAYRFAVYRCTGIFIRYAYQYFVSAVPYTYRIA